MNPVRNPKGPEVKYRKWLQNIAKRLKADINEHLVPVLKRLQPEYVNDAYAKTLEQVFENLRRNYVDIGRNAAIVSSSFTEDVNQVNKQRFYKAMESAIGIDLNNVLQNEGLEDIMYATTKENVALIKTIPEEYFKQIEGVVFRGTVQGRDATSMIKQITRIGYSTEKRARLIARDQTSKLNSALNQQRSQNLGVEEYVWRTANDERVRDSHKSKNGKTFRWDTPPKDTGHPGQDIQCFPGNTEVMLLGDVRKLFRRRYTGELSFFVTENNKVIRSTPNHLHLTSTGWVAAKHIKIGDYVVNVSDHSINSVEAYSHKIISFEDMFRAINMLIPAISTLGSEVQFHGDGTIDHDINIINFESELWGTMEPSITEKVDKLMFSFTASRISSLVGFSEFDHIRSSLFNSSVSLVSILSEFLSIFEREFSHAVKHDFTISSNSNPVIDKSGLDRPSCNPCELGDIIDCIPADIPIDDKLYIELLRVVGRAIMSWYSIPCNPKITAESAGRNPELISGLFNKGTGINELFSRVKEIGTEWYSGHVYNLETENNWYIANNIITHNCRCVAQAIIKV